MLNKANKFSSSNINQIFRTPISRIESVLFENKRDLGKAFELFKIFEKDSKLNEAKKLSFDRKEAEIIAIQKSKNKMYLLTLFFSFLLLTLCASLFYQRKKNQNIYASLEKIYPGFQSKISSLVEFNNKEILLTERLENLDVHLYEEYSNSKISNEDQAVIIDDLKSYLYIITHDLKLPLAQIKEGLNNLSDQEDSKQNQIIHETTKTVIYIENILSLFIEGERISDLKLMYSEFKVEELLEDIIDNLNFERSYFTFGKLPEITSDVLVIRQILQNLISNSIKATKDLTNPEISIWSETTDSESTLFVKDNGKGVEESQLEKIFELYFSNFKNNDTQTENSSGIGLHLSKKYAKKLKGNLTAFNTADATVFKLAIPNYQLVS